MSGEIFISGHSLGGQRAWQYAYSRIKRGLRVDGIYCLAPSKPGNRVIGQVLFAARAQFQAVRALKNRRDYVPSLPIDMEMIGEQYEQPWRLDEIDEAPSGPPDLDPDHAIALYVAGAKKIPDSPGVAIPLGAAADLVARLYVAADGWAWISPVSGAYAAVATLPNGARQAVFRGTQTPLEWLQDFDAAEIDVMGARMPRGGWAGVAAVQDAMDAALA